MKKVLILQAINIMVILLIAVLFYYRFCSLEDKQIKSGDDDSAKWMEQMYIENNMYEAIQNDNIQLDIPDLPSLGEPILICYYSSLTCGSCVNYAISKIEEHFPDVQDHSRIFYIACNFNEKISFQQPNTIRVNHRIPVLPIDESNSVCYFILSDKLVSHTFLPESNFGNYTDTYLKEIKKRYFKKIE